MTKEEITNSAREMEQQANALRAALNDEQLQIQDDNGKWKDIDIYQPNFKSFVCSPLRVKPKPKYRPYKDVTEFLAAQEEHGQRIKVTYEGNVKWCLPIDVEMEDNMLFVSFASNVWWSPISGAYSSVGAENLLSKNFQWQDGTICGVLENEG